MLPERFESKFIPEPNTGCWLWIAGIAGGGYGSYWNGTKKVSAHRFSYEQTRGPIPQGLEIDHLCRQRLCVNPEHLEAVTHRENVLRGDGWTAHQARQTHCHRGHPLTPDNL